MSSISRLTTALPAPPVPSKVGGSEADPRVAKAAKEFEATFVRQILRSAKVGGDDQAGGYAGMAVDAMTSAVADGGGLGLARQIEEAVERAHSGGAK